MKQSQYNQRLSVQIANLANLGCDTRNCNYRSNLVLSVELSLRLAMRWSNADMTICVTSFFFMNSMRVLSVVKKDSLRLRLVDWIPYTSTIDAARTKSKRKRYFCAFGTPTNMVAWAPPQVTFPTARPQHSKYHTPSIRLLFYFCVNRNAMFTKNNDYVSTLENHCTFTMSIKQLPTLVIYPIESSTDQSFNRYSDQRTIGAS